MLFFANTVPRSARNPLGFLFFRLAIPIGSPLNAGRASRKDNNPVDRGKVHGK
jgi:hypothetical protein